MNFETTFITAENVENYIHQQHVMRYLFTNNYVKDKSVLDVGCGIGYGTAWLANSACKIIGADHSFEAIDYAQKHWQKRNLEFMCADAVRLPFADQQFDVIVSFEMIEHLADPRPFLEEAKRLLVPGGHFLCSTPRRLPFNRYEAHLREYSLQEFRKLLRGYFQNVEIQGQYTRRIHLLREMGDQWRCAFFHFGKLTLQRLPGGLAFAERLKCMLNQKNSFSPESCMSTANPYKISPEDVKRFQSYEVKPLQCDFRRVLRIMVAACR